MAGWRRHHPGSEESADSFHPLRTFHRVASPACGKSATLPRTPALAGRHAMHAEVACATAVAPAMVPVGTRSPGKFFTGSRREWAAPQLVGGGVLVKNFPEVYFRMPVKCRSTRVG